jgi:hypothetical protein
MIIQNSTFKNQKSKVKIISFLTAILTLTFCFLTFGKVFAQNAPSNYDVTVSPVFFDLSTNPGTKLTERVRIRNNTTSPLPIKLEVKRLTGDTNGELTLRDTNPDNSLSWIKFDNDKIVAKPLEWTDVNFTIDIPAEAAYGYYFAISFTQDNTSSIKRTGTTITGAAAVPILLNVKKPGASAQAKLLQFSVQNYINEYLPVNFNVKVTNQGNVHVSPHGNIFISNGSNKDIAVLDVNNALSNIIPNTNKTFEVSWLDGFIVKQPVMENNQPKLDKNGKPVEFLQINWDKLTSFRFGKYTANLILVYDNGTKDVPIEANVSFWVIPYKVIISMVIFVVVAFFIIRFLLRLYINREISKRTKTN